MDIQTIKAIDSHIHFTHLEREHNDMHDSSLTTLRKLGEAAHFGEMFFSTLESVEDASRVAEENDYLWELSQEFDDLYQWVVIDPRNEKTFEQAKKMLNHGKCVGIKLHPTNHQYTLAEYGDKLFSFASEYGAICQLHPEENATWILPHADKYPDVTFIVAHAGSWHGRAYADAIEQARHGNVYADTSGSASITNWAVEYIVERVGSDKLLFGTDGYAAGFQRGRIDYALISDQDKENILRNNALRLFGKFLKG